MTKFITHHLDAYIRYLHLAREHSHVPYLEKFDAIERAQFEAIMLAWGDGKPLAVSEAMRVDHLGSTSTQHKRLVRLRQMELIVDQYQSDDRRTKFLVPSEKGLKYASQVGRMLLKSMDD